MKKYILIVLLFLAYANVEAQHSISGQIYDDKDGESLPGVSIYIADLKRGTFTDIDGRYSLDDLRSGVYLLEISYIGYKTITMELNLSENAEKNFHLIPAVTELNEIFVTGVSRSTEKMQSPIIIKALDKNFLAQTSSGNLIDGLKTIPGVDQITTGPSISKPTIRGLGFNRLLTLKNGIRQEGQQWGDEHGIEIDAYEVDRVEIIKGPGSLMYGSDGIAGVLNFLSPKPVPIGKTRTQFLSEYQHNNMLLAQSISHAENRNGLQWRARLTGKMAGNYSNRYDGKVLNSGYKEYDGSIFLGVNKKWGFSHLNLSTFNTNLGIIEGERDSLGQFTFIQPDGKEVSAQDPDLAGYGIGFPRQTIRHHSISSNNYFLLNHGSINADIGYQYNQRQEYEEIEHPDDAELALILNTISYNFRYNTEKWRGWESSTGISGMYQDNHNAGEEFLIPDYTSFDVGLFVFSQKTMHKLTFAAGLRYDNRYMHSASLYLDEEGEPTNSPELITSTKFEELKKSFGGLSGSLGVSYRFNDLSTLKFNLSRGFRAPNIAELTSNGKHEGTFRYEIGNRDLQSESSNQVDVGYYLNTEHVTFELSPFINYIDNYVYIQKLVSNSGQDSIPDPLNPVPAYEFVGGDAFLYGGEVYLDFHPHPLDWLHIAQSFSMVRAILSGQSGDMKYLPSIPAPKYRAEVKAEFNHLSKNISDVLFTISMDHYFKQNRIFSAYGTERSNPAYTLFNLGVGTHIRAMGKRDFISLFLNAHNITDVAYQSHLSRLKYADVNPATGRIGVYNMGRNLSIKLIINI